VSNLIGNADTDLITRLRGLQRTMLVGAGMKTSAIDDAIAMLERHRTQLAEATRKLEEARKDAEDAKRWRDWCEVLAKAQQESSAMSAQISSSTALSHEQLNTPLDPPRIIDQAIEQGKGGDEA
jgi:hypothetical protein